MKHTWRAIAFLLVTISALVYLFWFAIFGDAREIQVWFLGCLAFLPLQVLLVTLVLERVIAVREREERLEKLNVVIGAFFSELGRDLLLRFSDIDPKLVKIKNELMFNGTWTSADFDRLVIKLLSYDFGVEMRNLDLEKLREHMQRKREFLLRMMENPNLLEHETFTDLLRALFHVVEELEARKDFSALPPSDMAHLRADIDRSYRLLVVEWLSYMKYLKKEYPYLFHLALRQNPFDESVDIVVRD